MKDVVAVLKLGVCFKVLLTNIVFSQPRGACASPLYIFFCYLKKEWSNLFSLIVVGISILIAVIMKNFVINLVICIPRRH